MVVIASCERLLLSSQLSSVGEQCSLDYKPVKLVLKNTFRVSPATQYVLYSAAFPCIVSFFIPVRQSKISKMPLLFSVYTVWELLEKDKHLLLFVARSANLAYNM